MYYLSEYDTVYESEVWRREFATIEIATEYLKKCLEIDAEDENNRRFSYTIERN